MTPLSHRYFQDELTYLREMGREFARLYPALAPLLGERSGDPDVERLLEGVAFLTGRIRQKVDDELPEFIHGVAQLLFPDFLRPVPASTIMELTPRANVLRDPTVVPAGTEFGSLEVEGVSCPFRSTVDCELLPWVLEAASLQQISGDYHELAVDLRLPSGISLEDGRIRKVRLHLGGESSRGLSLLMWLMEQPVTTFLVDVDTGREVSLGKGALQPVGFEESEGLFPHSPMVVPGLRLLQEYYTLPAKFAFVDVIHLERLRELGSKLSRLRIALRCDTAPPGNVRVSKETIRLHCVPAVNVFATTAEPLRIGPTRGEYLVRSAGLTPAQGEVYALQKLEAIGSGPSGRWEIPSFFDFSTTRSGLDRPFYVPHIRPSSLHEGAEVTVSFNTPEDRGAFAESEVVAVDILATNRSLASALRAGDVCVPTTTSPAFITFRNISAPTAYVPPPFGRDLQWRVVAHTAMGLSGLTDAGTLRAIMDTYNFQATVDAQAARANELRLAAVQTVRFSPDEHLYRSSIIRGIAVDVELADSGFAGQGDMYLFGAVLDRLFASYVSINSYARTTVHGVPSKVRFSWRPRSGRRTLF